MSSLPSVQALFSLAIQAANSYRGQCAPNPAVAAVIVADGEVIAVGAHKGCGKPHAEIEALGQAGERARGAVMLVTLEPCCHHGRTPPCTDAIIKAGIQSVFYAYQDPNPIVAGQGVRQLREAGVMCEYVPVPEVDAMYRAYVHWIHTKTPYIKAKLACSFDGKVAHADGVPAQISGDVANNKTADDRAVADAIITSVTTIVADNPRLSSRRFGSTLKRPVWVLDTNLHLPLDARLWETASSLTLCHADAVSPSSALQQRNAMFEVFALDEHGRLPWQALLERMGERGLHEVWVEAGPTIVESLHASGCLNELIVSMSPCVLGADATPGFTQVTDFTANAASVHWETYAETARCVIRYD